MCICEKVFLYLHCQTNYKTQKHKKMTNTITTNEMTIANKLCENSGLTVKARTFAMQFENDPHGLCGNDFVTFVKKELNRFKRLVHAENSQRYVNVATGKRVANPHSTRLNNVDVSISVGDCVAVNHPKLAGEQCTVIRVNGKTFTIKTESGNQYRATKSMISLW